MAFEIQLRSNGNSPFDVTLSSESITYGGVLKRWTGSAWTTACFHYYNGSSWVNKPMKIWTGTEWLQVQSLECTPP